jgi:hypothetical protein
VLKPQSEFPLLERYKKYFPIHDNVIFAYGEYIYTNYPLTPDLLIHEKTHLAQQKHYGLDIWVDKYLNNVEFRAKMEEEAYRKQLNSIKDREHRNKIKLQTLSTLASGLYGDSVVKL